MTLRAVLLAAVTLSVVVASCPAPAQRKRPRASQQTTGPQDYRSRNFLVHTDLSRDEANDLLKRLETMLTIISRYWGRPNRQLIECYVVKDVKKWPAGSIDPRGLSSIRDGAGVTLSTTTFVGARSHTRAIVYAVSDRGTPQHESVHAYCSQAFGTTGPVWYSEGMAEMGQYWRTKDANAVHCSEFVCKYLRTSKPKSLNEIVNSNDRTGDSWQNYAWRWALCHVLANNTNYASRFRPLGLGMLTKRPVSFEQVYGSMAKEISFEYLLFLKHVAPGYRADLCSWDWKTKYKRPIGPAVLNSKINAKAGWQPSRFLVKTGDEIEFAATGTWKLSKAGKSLSADGDAGGAGRLQAVIFNDYQLSEAFDLGAYGSFKVPSDGNLLLRCGDKWTELSDNTGKISVKLKFKGKGRPLPKPAG